MTSSSTETDKKTLQKHKLFEFEFRTVFENPKCFPVFLSQAANEYNAEIVIMFTHLEWFHAMTADRANLFEHFITLTEKNGSSGILKGAKQRILGLELSRLGLQQQQNGSLTDRSGNTTPTSPISPNKLATFFSRVRHPSSPSTSHQSFQSDFTNISLNEKDQDLCNMCELYAHCASLMEVFVKNGTKHEVNISHGVRNDLTIRWEEFMRLYYQSVEVIIGHNEQEAESSSAASSSSQANNTTQHEEYLLCDSAQELKKQCALLFNSCRLALEMTLSDDMFPRFKRSKTWLKFVQSCSLDEIAKFGENRASSTIEPLRLSLEDMARSMITPKDVSLARVILRDYYHWKVLKQKKLALYYSDIRFLQNDALGVHGHLNAYKTTYEFNTTAANFAAMFLSKQYYTAISEMEVDCVAYIPMETRPVTPNTPSAANVANMVFPVTGSSSTTNARYINNILSNRTRDTLEQPKEIIHYGSTVLYEKKSTALVKREFVQTSTVFYEPGTRSYFYVFKYCEHKDLPEVVKGFVRGVSYGVASFTENAGKCRYNSVFMVNLKGLMASKTEKPGLLARQGVAYHTKGTIKKMEEYVEEARKVNFQLEDDLQLMRPLREYCAEFQIVPEV